MRPKLDVVTDGKEHEFFILNFLGFFQNLSELVHSLHLDSLDVKWEQ